MLKWAGAFLICISSCLFSGCLAGEWKEKSRLLGEFKRCFMMIRGEIRFANATLPEAFLAMRHRSAPPFSALFEETGQALLAQSEQSLGEIWSDQVRRQLPVSLFTKEEVEWMADFGKQLGYLDKEMQLNILNLILEQLEQKEQEAAAGLKEKGRLCRWAGILGGIFVAVLLF